jgi:hypothetical protein
MNYKTTCSLVALAALLFCYIHFVEWRGPDQAQRLQQASRLLPEFDPGKVAAIEVVRGEQLIRAELSEGGWQLTTPSYPAQSTGIESLLQALSVLARQTEIPAEEIISGSGGMSPFGLDPPRASIALQVETNLIRLNIGSKTLLGDRLYVQPAGIPGIFTTDVALLDQLPKSAHEWRNPLIIHAGTLVIDRINITTGVRKLMLERDSTNQMWRMVEPMKTRAQFNLVEFLIQQMRTARVYQFVTDDPKADLEPFGLHAPQAQLTFSRGANPIFQIQFGKSPPDDPTQVYARRLHHTNVVLVSRELAELVQRPWSDFRDRGLLSFAPALVQRIEVKAEEEFALQREIDSDWQIVHPFQAPADRQLMQLFMEDLSRLEVIRFENDVVTDFAPFGLAELQRHYVLKAAIQQGGSLTNYTLARVEFGANPSNELDKIYCRRSDESSVYAVAFGDMLRLPRAAFSLRDRRIWSFASSNVTAMTIQHREQKRELLRDPVSRMWSKDDQIAHAAVEETLYRLGQLQAENWVARGHDQAKLFRTDGSEYQLTLHLQESGKSHQLVLGLRVLLSGQPYASVILEQGQPVVFKFPVALYGLVAQHLGIPSLTADL